MEKINVAVIGLGNMGRHHVRNYSEIPEANLVAVCDRNADISADFSSRFSCKGYTDLEDMLTNESIDAVTITVPTALHFSIAKTVLSHKKHVLIEKPICDSIEKAQELIAYAETQGVLIMVGHIERFNPAVQTLKTLIDDGKLGKITSLLSRRIGVFPAQIKDANVIIDLAVHDIDIFSMLLDRQPDHIYGNAGKALIDDREDHAELLLTYGNQSGFMQVNWITPIRIRTLCVTGSKGYAELNYMTQELTLYESSYQTKIDANGDPAIVFDTPKEQIIDVPKKEPLREELSHFLDCIRHQKTPLISGAVGLSALKTALEVMTTMTSGALKTSS